MESAVKKLKVYCETSFWSYLVGGPTSDEKVARWQALTRKWWEDIAPKCEIYVSQHVFRESIKGNHDKAAQRLGLIAAAHEVDGSGDDINRLSALLTTSHAIPDTESTDAEHIATASVRGLDVLLTWNCRHLANPRTLPRTVSVVARAGYECPAILTPEEFLNRREEFGI